MTERRRIRFRLASDAPRVAARVALICAGLLGVVALPYALGFRVLGPSRSMPRGVYRLSAAEPTPGRIVLTCLPEAVAEYGRQQRYLLRRESRLACPGGAQPAGKLLAAAAGDEVVLAERGLYVNGLRVATWPMYVTEAHGAGEPPLRYTLDGGQVWLHAPHPRSWDSRHFGPIALSASAAVLDPVWTEDRTVLAATARRVRLAHARGGAWVHNSPGHREYTP